MMILITSVVSAFALVIIMPSLVATTSALAHTTCVCTHYIRTNCKLVSWL